MGLAIWGAYNLAHPQLLSLTTLSYLGSCPVSTRGDKYRPGSCCLSIELHPVILLVQSYGHWQEELHNSYHLIRSMTIKPRIDQILKSPTLSLFELFISF